MNHLSHLKLNTETVSGSSGSLPMSGRNGSASDADCRISEDCRVPDVELMELGPLLEEGGGRPAASKGSHVEVGLVFRRFKGKSCSSFVASEFSCDLSKGSCDAC